MTDRVSSQYIRRRIRGTGKRLIEHLAEEYSLSPNPTAGATTDQDKLDELTDRLNVLGNYKDKIGTSLSVLYESSRDWMSLLEDLKPEDREEEAKLQKEFIEEAEECDYVNLLDKAQDVVDKLKMQEAALRKVIVPLQRKVDAAAKGSAGASGGAGSTPSGTTGAAPPSLVSLPMMELPRYSGNILKWEEFWDLFSSTVDKSALSERQKFSYLKTSLEGKAAKLIEGLSVTEANYDVAKGLLKDAYGKKDHVVQALYRELDELPRPKGDAVGLRDFMQSLEKVCRQLEKLGEDLDQKKIVVQLEGKMPGLVLNRVAEAKRTASTWSTKEFRNTLKTIVELREDVESMQSLQPEGNKHSSRDNRPRKPQGKRPVDPPRLRPSAAFVTVKGKQRRPPKCIFCTEPHYGSDCRKYATLEQRRARLRELQRCMRCLGVGHMQKDCRADRPCLFCQSKSHHTAMCDSKRNSSSADRPRQAGGQKAKPFRKGKPQRAMAVASQDVDVAQDRDQLGFEPADEPQWVRTNTVVVTSSNSVNESRASDSLLLTARAKVYNPKLAGKQKETALFLDNGSQPSFVTLDLAKSLGLQQTGQEELLLTTLTTTKAPVRAVCPSYDMAIKLADGSSKLLTVYGREKLLGRIPVVDVKPVRDRAPDGKRWYVRVHYKAPEVLIGANYYWHFGISEVDKLPSGLIINDSELGFMAAGKLGNLGKQSNGVNAVSVNMLMIAPESGYSSNAEESAPEEPASNDARRKRRKKKLPILSQRQIERFMRWESIGIFDDPLQASEDEAVMDQFLRSVLFRNGRYCVQLPIVSGPLNLPTNYEMCLKRLANAFFRLLRDPEILRMYDAIIKQQLDEGILELVYELLTDFLVHYLPHQAVVRMTKKSTKVRIVYDASAAVRGHRSLNDCLHRGPVFLPDLVGLFLRLRLAPIAVLSDIERAFLMMELHECHRDLTRFLWLRDIDRGLDPDNIVVLRFARVPFGLKSSPFLLTAVLRKHLDDDGSDLAHEIKQSVYMDNVFYTAQTPAEAINKSHQAIEIFKRAGMNLRQFVSNSQEVNEQLGEPGETVTKFLGVQWDTVTDKLALKLPAPTERTETKRTVLSLTAQVYDPTGKLAPVTFRAKTYFQTLWKSKVYQWDTPLDRGDAEQWRELTQDWGSQVEIPRLIVKGQPLSYQVIVFTDASIKASAVAVYLRVRYNDRVESYLIFAKTRLSPIKTPTIPRLELVGVVMGVRAAHFVRKELHLELELCSIFTDSSCVLSWIMSGTENLPTFVLNRVKEIRSASDCAFGFVSTGDNPADLATRGLTVNELRESQLWWHGPEWICKAPEDWPKQPRLYKEAERLQTEDEHDEIAAVAAAAIAAVLPPVDQVVDVSRFSRLSRLTRATAYMLRAALKLLAAVQQERSVLKAALPHTPSSGMLTPQELKEADRFLLRQEQRMYPPSEEERSMWSLQLGRHGLLLSADRLQYSSLDEDRKQVVFLPRESRLLRLIILRLHEKGFHCGVQQSLASLRQQVWCPKARQMVRKTIRSQCMHCRKQFAKPYRLPQFPPLPKERVSRADAFTNIGLDYLGPFALQAPGGVEKKAWVLLVSCMVTRAVHLELVLEMTAVAFLRAFRRFVARRRKPRVVLSDNQAAFKLTASVINCGWDDRHIDSSVSDYMATEQIEWRFTPSLQPWQGGMYERLVGIYKKAFRAAAGRRTLKYDEAQTTIVEIESLINHRPLFYVLDDQDIILLRPIDLVQTGENDPGIAFSLEEDDENGDYAYGRLSNHGQLVKQWKGDLKGSTRFWVSFHDDYLPDQRDRKQRRHRQKHTAPVQPQIGHIVIIKEDRAPRGLWKLGRIVGLRGGHQDQLRTADLQLKNGNILNRSVGMLYPLEVTDDEVQPTAPANEDHQETQQAEVNAEAEAEADDILEKQHDPRAAHQPAVLNNAAEDREEERPLFQAIPAGIERANARYSLRPQPRATLPFSFTLLCVFLLMSQKFLLVGGRVIAETVTRHKEPDSEDLLSCLTGVCVFLAATVTLLLVGSHWGRGRGFRALIQTENSRDIERGDNRLANASTVTAVTSQALDRWGPPPPLMQREPQRRSFKDAVNSAGFSSWNERMKVRKSDDANPIPDDVLAGGKIVPRCLRAPQLFGASEVLLEVLGFVNADGLFSFRNAARFPYAFWQQNKHRLHLVHDDCAHCNSRNHKEDDCPVFEARMNAEDLERRHRKKRAAEKRKRKRRAKRRHFRKHPTACRWCGKVGQKGCKPGWTCRGPKFVSTSDEESDDASGRTMVRPPRKQRTPSFDLTATFASLFLLTLLPACQAQISTAAAGRTCDFRNGSHVLLAGSECRTAGYLIFSEVETKSLCYSNFSCPKDKHMRNVNSLHGKRWEQVKESSICHGQCACQQAIRNWSSLSHGCSFYRGPMMATSTVRSQKARKVLRALKPPYCLEAKPECPVEHYVMANVVELFDGSQHQVSPLRLAHQDYHPDDVQCATLSEDHGVTGTPEYCAVNNCTQDAKKFCWYNHNERVLLDSPAGQLLIKQWATVFSAGYLPDRHQARRHLVNSSWHRVKCQPKGFEVTSNVRGMTLQVCSGGVCRRLRSSRTAEDIVFPKAYLLYSHIVQLTVWYRGHVLYQEEVECPPTDICDLIECNYCLEMVRNARCAPTWMAIAIAATSTMLLAGVLAAVAGTSWYFWKKRRASWSLLPAQEVRFEQRSEHIELRTLETSSTKAQPQRSASLSERLKPKRSKEQRRTRSRTLPYKLAFFVVLQLVAPASACSKTEVLRADLDQCKIDEVGRLNCSLTHATRATVSNQGQTLCFLVKDSADTPLGSLTMRVAPLQLVCDPIREKYVRDFHVETASTKRCSGMGSCGEERCAQLLPNETVPELEVVSHFPGFSKCFSSCGCWGCFCFLCSDGCVFMRLIAKPRDNRVGRIFECAWHVEAHIAVELHVGNQTTTALRRVRLGQETKSDGLELGLREVSLPPMPQVHRQFVADFHNVALLRPNQQTVTCDDERNAFSLTMDNCTFPQHTCSCHETRGSAHCDCDESIYVLRNLDNPDLVLPRHEGPVWLKHEKGQVTAETYLGTAELCVNMEALKLQLKVYNNSCVIEAKNLTGSFSSSSGAILEYGCTTDFGSALAHVHCPSADFYAHCNKTTVWQKRQLLLSQSNVREQCEVICSRNRTSFELQGVLHYAHASHEELMTPDLENFTPEFRASDLLNLVWKSVLLPDLKIWLATALVALVLAIIGILLGLLQCLQERLPTVPKTPGA